MVSKAELLPLRGTFQSYTWGKEISKSIFASFVSTQPELPESGIVAELWLGSHPNGDSKVQIDNSWKSLKDHLKVCAVPTKFNFLTKILCINQPLSIQLHPDADEAIKLNQENPKNFPDSNPKPEMAIALNNVELLCGVRPLDDLIDLIETHQAFSCTKKFNPREALSAGGISKLFEIILSLDSGELNRIANIFKSFEPETPHDMISNTLINSETPYDAGILALHLLSYHKIVKNDAIYIKPNIPHAYISGEAFECMKNSDNVVRGGATSKTIDVKNFCRLVETTPYDPRLNADKVNSYTNRYVNPELPFTVDHLEFNSESIIPIELEKEDNHEIILVISGTGSIQLNGLNFELSPGSSFYSDKRSSMIMHGENLNLFRVVATPN